MKRLNYILLIAAFVLLGCNKKTTDKEFEQSVFDEVFINIVDSTYIDQRIYSNPPTKAEESDPDFIAAINALEKDSLNLIIALENEGLIDEKTNLNKYKTPKFTFKHLSEHPRGRDLEYSDWKVSYPKFAGVMSFSHIEFDSKKESGSLEVSYSCGGKCGLGYKVYLKKLKGKWKVMKKENTWIS